MIDLIFLLYYKIIMPSIDDFNSDPLIGKRLGTCTILKELARGGMGIVFIAYQQTLKRQIALKLIPKSYFKSEVTERFHHEAEAAAILSHPNIVPIYEIGETEEFLFFTMQLVKGDSLARVLEKVQSHFLLSRRILPIKATIRIISQLLDALDYAHNEEIIHRDIKPDNILMENHTKRPLISDFGLAKVLRGDNLDFVLRGTPAYMAPEQILGLKVDGRTDIYGVGVVLFEMLVPELPLLENEATESFLKRKAYDKKGVFLKNPSDLNPNLHREMDEIVSRAIAYEPDDRYPTCRDFLRNLEKYQENYLK